MDSKLVAWLIIYAVGVLLMLSLFSNFGDLALDAFCKKREDMKDKAEKHKALDGRK